MYLHQYQTIVLEIMQIFEKPVGFNPVSPYSARENVGITGSHNNIHKRQYYCCLLCLREMTLTLCRILSR
jgi:hypothetical protein